MNTEEVLARVEQLPGMEDFKDLCARLRMAAENITRQQLRSVPLPNLIFAAAPGCGITLHIGLLTELLKSLRLLDFAGEEEYFEWALADDEKDFDRFLLRVRQAAGFYGQFHGVIGLDISAMLEDRDQLPDMARLMEYMEARQGKIVFVLIVSDHTSESTLRQLLGLFASITPAELVRMPFPYREAQAYITGQLQRKGFSVSPDAQEILADTVVRLSGTDAFEGYQTLQNLAEEIIWRKISAGTMDNAQITGGDLRFIQAEDGYVSRLNAYAHRIHKRKVGFGSALEG